MAELCDVCRHTILAWQKIGLRMWKIPGDAGMHHRVDPRSLMRVLLSQRHEPALRRLGWVPSALLVGTGTRMASTVTELVPGIKVHYAETTYEAGWLCAQHEPASIVLDLAVGRKECLALCDYVKRVRPWVRLIALDHGGDWADREVTERTADASVLAPFDPQEIADHILCGLSE